MIRIIRNPWWYINTNYYIILNSTVKILLIKKVFRIEHLNTEEIISVKYICSVFADIFHLEGDKLTNNLSIEHKTHTPVKHSPIYQWNFKFMLIRIFLVHISIILHGSRIYLKYQESMRFIILLKIVNIYKYIFR